jgi:serine/threonine protein kinase
MAEDVFGIVGSVIASAYHVESVVAEGGFGVVYRAHHGGFRAPVALKLLKVPQQDPQQQQAFLELFRSEAELLFRLSASLPAVVRALHVDSFTSKAGRFVPYLVLEWLEGMTLEALIAQRRQANLPPVSLRKLVRLLTPVARALERAHNFNGPEGVVSIVHRDLKPENIFIAQLAGEETVKILDFGIGKVKGVASQVAGRMSQDGSAPTAFTPAYGAPEQWAPRHYGQTGPWTDVWGLALCLVEVMLGRTAIEGDSATMMGIALDPKRRPTPRTEGIEVPDAVEEVFSRALSLDPRARQRHAGIFWNELVAALERPAPLAQARTIELADDLEFDPSSMRTAPSVRASAPYSVPLAVSSRAPAARSAAPSASVRSVAASAPFIVPDLELTPPPVSRRPSGERAVVQLQPDLIELDSSSLSAALELDQNEPWLDAPTSGVMSAGHLTSAPSTREPSRAARSSPPRVSADVSVPFETGFVAKIEPQALERRSLARRLRLAIALFAAAISVAIFDPIYAAATGEVLEIAGQRLSLFAGALLLLALGFAGRAVLPPE